MCVHTVYTYVRTRVPTCTHAQNYFMHAQTSNHVYASMTRVQEHALGEIRSPGPSPQKLPGKLGLTADVAQAQAQAGAAPARLSTHRDPREDPKLRTQILDSILI